ncbi:MAG: NAD(P)-dependent glycerol-1-phosphate dehydrogenase [Euryarchaeota archaeon]|jgi:glycerol-1-phosphate dehydrogenase [NAD(P)+]|uniref:NAD(P)-dependent glycerol-1-phosphate dehydrogenase n=1 Tax=Methanobacterium sp. MZD130B TaxID=3394378 RepID=UPI001755F1C7|nr:NAD(P)-dependent glycerol-1-phosphate dehydrogenase [Euryarchaeota archaeon]HHT18749.1 NAD(P)-dependent glycerol-1-phosphate dehydrogenase [Methanobacterium sp.]
MDFNRVKLPREIHSGPGVITETGSICKDLKLTGKLLVATGPHTLKVAGEKVIESLNAYDFDADTVIVEKASTDAVRQVQDSMGSVDAVLGVGGGKVIDVAKMAATNLGVHSISIPTAASHDGISSPRASIKNQEGSVSMEVEPPVGIIADTQIISQAPFRLLAAGCGDIISNYTAILDWKLAHRLLNEDFSDSSAALSLITAETMIKSAGDIKEGLIESAAIVVKALISSGMAISIAGNSRPASGAEHKFSHALDIIAPEPALHGEQCGIGSIMMMYLHGGDWEFIRDTLKTIKAPINASQLGIDPQYIIEALTKSHTIRKERYTILGDRGLTEKAAETLARKTRVID